MKSLWLWHTADWTTDLALPPIPFSTALLPGGHNVSSFPSPHSLGDDVPASPKPQKQGAKQAWTGICEPKQTFLPFKRCLSGMQSDCTHIFHMWYHFLTTHVWELIWNVISAIRPTLADTAWPPFNTWLAKLQEWGQWPHLLPPHISIPPVGTLHPCPPYKDYQDALYKSSETRALNSVADVHPQSSFPDGETQSGWCDMTLLNLH